MSNERASSASAKALTADTGGQSRQALDARRAAEELFKSQERAALIDGRWPKTDGPAPTERSSQRKPRILAASPATAALPETEIDNAVPKVGEVAPKGQRPTEIPTSDYRRVRALAEYGMTLRQIAKSYGVTQKEVKRIVRT